MPGHNSNETSAKSPHIPSETLRVPIILPSLQSSAHMKLVALICLQTNQVAKQSDTSDWPINTNPQNI